MKIKIQIKINERYWLHRLLRFLPCRHELVRVTENPYTRYGLQSSYSYCLKCGRKAMEIGRHCKHKENCFGECEYCGERLSKFDCKHKWVNEPDTDDYFCELCGEWKNESNSEPE